MNKFKIFSMALIATTIAKAQDLEPAKKAIDAEQFEKAKSLLKSIIQAKPSNGKAAFLLGTIYLKQNSKQTPNQKLSILGYKSFNNYKPITTQYPKKSIT
jgi:thioredoxin-like negative regulator of GroEL